MASFSLARVPYYIAVAVFTGLSALVAYYNNTTVTGITSDIYLLVMVASVVLCGASILYLFTARGGHDDEVDLHVAGLQFGKSFYYFGVIALALYRIAVGYVENHAGTGLQSTWGILWLLSGIGILAFTYANYKSYAAKLPVSSASTSTSAPWKY